MLVLLLYAVSKQCENNRIVMEALVAKIKKIETKVDMDSQVDLFLHQLHSKGYYFDDGKMVKQR